MSDSSKDSRSGFLEPLWILLDGPPNHNSGRFIEVEDAGVGQGGEGWGWVEPGEEIVPGDSSTASAHWRLGPLYALTGAGEDLWSLVLGEMRMDLVEDPSRVTLPYLRARMAQWIAALGGEAPPLEIVQPPSEATLREISRELGPRFLNRESLDLACSQIQSALSLLGDLACPPTPLMGEAVRHIGNALETIGDLYRELPGEVPHGA